ncbi:hypothetical protein M409DRAFT_24244 [Zasmidium cellare ATCC 36951]|uniref:Zn(2)-C6 fungal-type domain-containing protein n=1 Tax=Zasmidium cellare ATCC 36951 TaxID=1080233 RepID=A0A6A6CDW2_ZASCE|nr:uncharacterized protein M409DRAFT_24244 [Zasmidium cellare ATCC 36951]KAF2165394.1 hypothetical protein M409DRAFT_24244 [Zasmidium cellare ATCC 36951]
MSPSPMPIRRLPRTRIRQACQACRRRRRKCDGLWPCRLCKAHGYTCVFEPRGSADKAKVTGPPSAVVVSDDHPPPHASDQSPEDVEAGDAEVSARFSSRSIAELPQSQVHGQPGSSKEQKPPVIDLVKGRYCDASGSCVFPLFVSQSIQSRVALRPHAYGWNINTRLEPSPPSVSSIRRFLAYQEVALYSQCFFEAVGRSYCFVDAGSFHQRTLQYWTDDSAISHGLEAMICGVLILGSLFSATGIMAESQLVEHAKLILDNSISCALGRLTLDLACAWVLRTLYLRLTTRPSLAWFASCTSVHVAESLGLHADLDKFHGRPASIEDSEIRKTRRNILNCAVFLNTLISAEYGRSRLTLELWPSSIDNEDNSVLVTLAQVLRNPSDDDEDVVATLGSLADLTSEVPHLALLIADVALFLYRKRIHQNNGQLSSSGYKALLSILDGGIGRARESAASQLPWWNVLSTPFQTLLVLIHVNTTESLALVRKAMEALEMVNTAFTSSSLVREALVVAQLIVGTLRERKLQQVDLLPSFDASGDPVTGACNGSSGIDLNISQLLSPTDWPSIDWLQDLDLSSRQGPT